MDIIKFEYSKPRKSPSKSNSAINWTCIYTRKSTQILKYKIIVLMCSQWCRSQEERKVIPSKSQKNFKSLNYFKNQKVY